MADIYFDSNYGKLYEGIEKGKNEVFEFECSYGRIKHMFIKRRIPNKINGDIYYDIITPYGYGGPIIFECKENCKKLLVEEYAREFQAFCLDNNIVSEFVRFHPIINNVEDFKTLYNTLHIRNTVGTNLKDFIDPFQEEFSKSCRKNVRKALRNGVNFKVTESPNDVSEFLEIYYSTMDRNKATDYYYFNKDYFNDCVRYFKGNLLLVEAVYENETIAMGFYFVYEDYIHIHLSGTLTEYLSLSPAYILRYAVTQWGKENGYKLIHHGGGRTNEDDDSLYKFKKQFGKNTEFEFHVGKKIWNSIIYKQLCEMNGIDVDIEFFPAYRSEG